MSSNSQQDSNKKESHRARIREALFAIAVCMMYPAIVLRSVFFGGFQARLGSTINDMNGTLFEIQSLKYMKYPWSYTLRSSFPDGENFWMVFRIVHGLVWILAWLLVQFFSPALTLGLLVLFGWTISGLSVYLVARTISVSKGWSLCGAVLVQMLPWFELKSEDHLFYVYMGIPLFVIMAGLRFVQSLGMREFVVLQISCVATFFIDTYLFAFSILGAFVVFCEALSRVHFRQRLYTQVRMLHLSRSARVAIWTGFLLLFLMSIYAVIGLFLLFNRQVATFGENSRGVTSQANIEKWTGRIRDLISPMDNHWIVKIREYDPGNTDIVMYGSVVVMVLVGAALFSRALRRTTGVPWTLFVVSVMYIMLAVRTVSIAGVDLSFSNLVRFVFPGIRVFARSAVLGQMLLVVLAIWFVNTQFKKIRLTTVRQLCSVLIVGALVIDLSPNPSHSISENFERYKRFQDVLESYGVGSGVLLPSGRLEPLELSIDGALDSIDFPLHNDIRRAWESQTYLHAALGQGDFASYLLENSIRFVIARVDGTGRPVVRGFIQDAVRVNLTLNEPYFSELSSQVTRDGDEVKLLRVNQKQKTSSCKECVLAQFVTVPQLDSLGASGKGLIDDTYWSPSREIEIHPEPLEELDQSGPVTLIFEVRSGDPGASFFVQDSDGLQILPQKIIGNSHWFSVVVDLKSKVIVSANSECEIPSSPNGLYCWGLGFFFAFQDRN